MDTVEEQEAKYIDITNGMLRLLDVLRNEYDMNATRALISSTCELLMSQGMTRDEAWRFVNEEWFA